MAKNPFQKIAITEEERQTFRTAMEKPFQYAPSPEKPPPASPDISDHPPPAFSGADYLAYLNETDWVNDEDILSFARQGVQNTLLKKLKQGQLPIEKKLDLHGLTAYEALAMMNEFLDNAQTQGLRSALVIHGKGKRPILKNLLNQWLPLQPMVSAFHSAQSRHGGAGAIYVLLKNKV